MLILDEARASYFEYLALSNKLMDRLLTTPNASDKVILSWSVYFCGGMSAKITEAFLLENIGHLHPSTRVRTNTKLNELHDLNTRQMRDDKTAWN